VRTPLVTRPIFIVGAGRSGTTLLRSLLSAHSRISIAPETHFMKRAVDEGGFGRDAPADFDAFWSRYTSALRFKDLAIDADRCRELIDQQGEHTFRSVFRAVLTAYGERVGKGRIGEKTPGHVHFLSELLEWFPDARVLVLQRDPRAVVASQLRTPWVASRRVSPSLRKGLFIGKRAYEVAFYADDWATIYEKVVPTWDADPRIMILSYEALVADAESALRTICDFLGESFEPALTNNRTNDTVPVAAGTPEIKDDLWRRWRSEHHTQTLRPVTTASIDKWKAGLSEADVSIIEGRCGKAMLAAGYIPSATALQQSIGRLFAGTLAAIGDAETRGRALVKRRIGPIPSFDRNTRKGG
jgi:hypothetical protein